MRSACWGIVVFVPDTKPVGRDRGGVDSEGILNPHRPQNLEFCGNGVEHRGHGNAPTLSPGLTTTKERLPQRPQNFTPSANRELHVEQATMPGMMLEWTPPLLLPCDGEG
jgi:hypothetical protein